MAYIDKIKKGAVTYDIQDARVPVPDVVSGGDNLYALTVNIDNQWEVGAVEPPQTFYTSLSNDNEMLTSVYLTGISKGTDDYRVFNPGEFAYYYLNTRYVSFSGQTAAIEDSESIYGVYITIPLSQYSVDESLRELSSLAGIEVTESNVQLVWANMTTPQKVGLIEQLMMAGLYQKNVSQPLMVVTNADDKDYIGYPVFDSVNHAVRMQLTLLEIATVSLTSLSDIALGTNFTNPISD